MMSFGLGETWYAQGIWNYKLLISLFCLSINDICKHDWYDDIFNLSRGQL